MGSVITTLSSCTQQETMWCTRQQVLLLASTWTPRRSQKSRPITVVTSGPRTPQLVSMPWSWTTGASFWVNTHHIHFTRKVKMSEGQHPWQRPHFLLCYFAWLHLSMPNFKFSHLLLNYFLFRSLTFTMFRVFILKYACNSLLYK